MDRWFQKLAEGNVTGALSAECRDEEASQDEANFTELMVLQEESKMLPFGAVWAEYCEQCGVTADKTWFEEVKAY